MAVQLAQGRPLTQGRSAKSFPLAPSHIMKFFEPFVPFRLDIYPLAKTFQHRKLRLHLPAFVCEAALSGVSFKASHKQTNSCLCLMTCTHSRDATKGTQAFWVFPSLCRRKLWEPPKRLVPDKPKSLSKASLSFGASRAPTSLRGCGKKRSGITSRRVEVEKQKHHISFPPFGCGSKRRYLFLFLGKPLSLVHFILGYGG